MFFDIEKLLPSANSASPANLLNESVEISGISEISNGLETENKLMVVCYTPNGAALKVIADSPEHAEQLLLWNPKP